LDANELAYTFGWRRSELLSLRCSQVNLPNRAIRLHPGTTKNKEGREVSMTPRVQELLLLATCGKKPDDFVLTRAGGEKVRDLRGAWARLCERARLGGWLCRACRLPWAPPECACGGRKRQYSLLPHDMRRSSAKALRTAGVPESVIMSIGGWKTNSMFRRYAIVSSSDQRAAVEMLERARAERVAA